MAETWGPVGHPTTEGKAPGEEGSVVSPGGHSTNYDATDGRHSKPNHEGWETVDTKGGTDVGEDGQAHGKFPDGPGCWRQT
jgi:hypothetical protein